MKEPNNRRCVFVKRVVPGLIGGIPIVDERNLQALKEIYDDVYVVEFQVKPLTLSLKHLFIRLKSLFWPVDEAYIDLINLIVKLQYVEVFFSSSKFGPEVKGIRKLFQELKIHVFFHNIESTMSIGRYKDARLFKDKVLECFSYIRNLIGEKYICQHATSLFVLNSRDRNVLNKLYRFRQDKVHLLPMSVKDNLLLKGIQPLSSRRFEKPLKLLFVGTAFWGNIPGVKAFISLCMPALNEMAELYVVGNGMEILAQELPSMRNVYYIGRVSDIELFNYYTHSDIFIAPITAGGGMKTKIAEAMMYGMPIIGTEEAFQGYDIPIDEIGYCSNDIGSYSSYINQIADNKVKLERMGKQSRVFYEQLYSLNSTINIFKSVL